MTSLATVKKDTSGTMAETDIETARRTLDTEIAGLQQLKDMLDDAFENAVETIQAMKDRKNGRLIITGMGKSGHIGQKMAATFASTGTPAYFVHPGEASHGDLGMITDNDVVIAISNSGGAPELGDIIAYTRRFSIPLISITSQKESKLGKHSDICLLLPQAKEACPNGLAPTTSTTMTIALGDCLAMALLSRQGLTSDDFKIWHPGGKIGSKLMPITALMDQLPDLPFVTPDQTMDTVIVTLTEKNMGCVIVSTDRQSYDGIITDGDLKRHMGPDFLSRTASFVMTDNPKTIDGDTLAGEAIEIMLKKYGTPITSLLVINKNKRLIGLLRLQTLLAAGVA
jgi:arabinose-5-phosphate isomerase